MSIRLLFYFFKAYEVLSDSKKRQQYDLHGSTDGSTNNQFNFNFDNFFRNFDFEEFGGGDGGGPFRFSFGNHGKHHSGREGDGSGHQRHPSGSPFFTFQDFFNDVN